MGDQERIRVDSELYVNQATVELLRRRIETEVKGNFFRSVGLPVGGAGVLAILFALFVWIPGQISTFIERDPSVQEKLKTSAVAYLDDPKRGQQFVRTQVETYLEAYLHDPAAGQRLIRQQTQETARQQVETITTNFFEESGPQLVQELAEQYLTSQAVRNLLIKTINETLQPKTAALSEEIRRNMRKLVVDIPTLKVKESPDVRHFPKGSIADLHAFLTSREAAALKRKHVPIALTLTIRRGPRYAAVAIRGYLKVLTGNFGEQFRHVLILNRDGRFLARLAPDAVKKILHRDANRFMDLVNSSDELSISQARKNLQQTFTRHSTASIQARWRVRQALLMPIWVSPVTSYEEVAVVDSKGKFKGITSRRRLIEGVLG